MKKMEKGITLVALVVTIIVLIILAGISINLILGDNGIITKAQEARNIHANAEASEGEMFQKYEQYITNATTQSGEIEKRIYLATIGNHDTIYKTKLLAETSEDVWETVGYKISDVTPTLSDIENGKFKFRVYGFDGNVSEWMNIQNGVQYEYFGYFEGLLKSFPSSGITPSFKDDNTTYFPHNVPEAGLYWAPILPDTFEEIWETIALYEYEYIDANNNTHTIIVNDDFTLPQVLHYVSISQNNFYKVSAISPSINELEAAILEIKDINTGNVQEISLSEEDGTIAIDETTGVITIMGGSGYIIPDGGATINGASFQKGIYVFDYALSTLIPGELSLVY